MYIVYEQQALFSQSCSRLKKRDTFNLWRTMVPDSILWTRKLRLRLTMQFAQGQQKSHKLTPAPHKSRTAVQHPRVGTRTDEPLLSAKTAHSCSALQGPLWIPGSPCSPAWQQ